MKDKKEAQDLKHIKLTVDDNETKTPPVVPNKPAPKTELSETDNTLVAPESKGTTGKQEAVYGDLELDSNSNGNQDKSAETFEIDQEKFYLRCVARVIDSMIVAALAIGLLTTIMSSIVITGGDESSTSLREMQNSMLMPQAPSVLFFAWLSALFFALVPGIAIIGIAGIALYDVSFKDILTCLNLLFVPVLGAIYQTLFLASKQQASIGKLLLGIRIVTKDGNKPSFLQCACRELIFLLSSLTFHVCTALPSLFSKVPNVPPLHDIIAKTASVGRKEALTASDFRGLLPFALAILSVVTISVAGTIYESTFGRESGARDVETAKALFGENSDVYLRQLWRYTNKRVLAGDYNHASKGVEDFKNLVGIAQLLNYRWGAHDVRVKELSRNILTETGMARYPGSYEMVMTLAANPEIYLGDETGFTPFGDLCQLYLSEAKKCPPETARGIYQKIYSLGKRRLASSSEKYKFLAAYLSATDALGYEKDLKEAIRDNSLSSYSLNDLERLHWSYWDYRLYKLIEADQPTSYGYYGDHVQIVSDLLKSESNPENKSYFSVPRATPNALEQKTIEHLGRYLTRDLKPSYWKAKVSH